MLSIDEKLYNRLPVELRAMFNELPNPERDEVVGEFPDTKSGAMSGIYKNTLMANKAGIRDGKEIHLQQEASSGSASRFFYCAKASKSERNMGCEGLEEKVSVGKASYGLRDLRMEQEQNRLTVKNNHPTVKPISLMKYLCRLITPPDGIVLDPYAGSGSTCIACKMEGFKFIGIEREPEYVKIAESRLSTNTFKQEVLINE